ncbi:MAG: hypothetical protein CR972_02415 [Candidatus Moraniibacteriota bacterium]|nr:MAG: hypothetical protein CR972_02415 [Candidatus Moranbacteria bacterium]
MEITGKLNKLDSLTRGEVDSVLIKIGHDAGMDVLEAIRAYLRGDLIIRPKGLFLKNDNGHHVFKIFGENYLGKEEADRIDAGILQMNIEAYQILINDDYNKNHLLEEDEEYTIVLVPSDEITEGRTVEEYGLSFNYQKMRAEAVLRMQEIVTQKQMKKMGFSDIMGVHMPISTLRGDFYSLGLSRCNSVGDEHCLLGAYSRTYDSQWNNLAFAFFAPGD